MLDYTSYEKISISLMNLPEIPIENLIDKTFYVGKGRNSFVGMWMKSLQTFVTIGLKFGVENTKYEDYWEKEDGCFYPVALLDDVIKAYLKLEEK